MDNLENQPSQPSQPSQPAPTPASPAGEDLQAQCASLASLLNSVLIMILVLAGTVDWYLMREVKITRAELNVTRAYAGQLGRALQAIEEFGRKLTDYGRTHPDFAPIANKYGLKPGVVTNGGPASSAPAPAPAPKPTKK